MKLVGADSSYIRGPFVVSGILYGLFAAILTLLVFLPTTLWLGDLANRFFVSFNAFDYYMSNFLQISAIIVVGGVAIGAISSYLASRRYLK